MMFVVSGTSNITGIYLGILGVSAFILGILSSILLMANRSIIKATICVIGVFSLGIATILTPPLLEGLRWDSYLVLSGPMIALSATSLFLVEFNYRKLKNSLTKGTQSTNEVNQTTIPA
jgi:hypothetical protein